MTRRDGCLPMGLVAAVAAVCSFALTACSGPEGQPVISVSPETIELGRIYAGEEATASFTVANAGSALLRITDIHTSCGCTKVNTPSAEIPPGVVETVTVKFNSRGFLGKTTKRVVIASNDTAHGVVAVSLVADVFQEIQLLGQDSFVNVGKLSHDGYTAVPLLFRNESDTTIRVQRIDKSDTTYRIRMKPATLGPGDTLRAVLEVRPARKGYSQGEIIVVSDSPRQPDIRFRVVYSY